jgi:hypothetical protein
MRVLIDSDAFCKLASGDLLNDALAIFGASLRDCGRLPALPYMLRKGRFLKTYGPETCANLVNLAESIEHIANPDPLWLDRLALVQDIDVGEAQLFAVAAGKSLMVITGDKRALQALKDIEGYAEALAGRVVVLEALLLVLCDWLGHAEVRRRLDLLTESDLTLKFCFSTDNRDPRGALASYYRDLVAAVRPLILWEPQIRGVA